MNKETKTGTRHPVFRRGQIVAYITDEFERTKVQNYIKPLLRGVQ